MNFNLKVTLWEITEIIKKKKEKSRHNHVPRRYLQVISKSKFQKINSNNNQKKFGLSPYRTLNHATVACFRKSKNFSGTSERCERCNSSPVRGRNPDLNSGLFVPRARPLPRSQTGMLNYHPTRASKKLHARQVPMSAAGIATLSWRWRPGWRRRADSRATVL